MLINREKAIAAVKAIEVPVGGFEDKIDAWLKAIDISAAALAALPVSDGWQPIETAPRDGTEFLAYGCYIYPNDDELTEYMAIAWYSYTKDYPWEDADGRHPGEFFCHWRPLPAPPTIE